MQGPRYYATAVSKDTNGGVSVLTLHTSNDAYYTRGYWGHYFDDS